MVLTAHHCIGYQNVIVGMYETLGYEGDWYRICKDVPHPHQRFEGGFERNDLRILFVCKPIKFSKNIQPALLPYRFMDDQFLEGKSLTASGWGWITQDRPEYPEVLMAVDVTGISNKQCDRIWDKRKISDDILCAHGEGGGKGACTYDSGGQFRVVV